MATIPLHPTEATAASSPRPTGDGLYGSRIGANMAAASAAELIGTALLVFAITATATAAALTVPVKGPAYDSLAIVLANGLALTALASALGHVSGAHFNPAVTIALAVTRRFPWKYVPAYVVAQMVGGGLGALATWGVGGHAARAQAMLGATAAGPGVSDGRAFLVEALITFVLVFVVIAVATDDRVPKAGVPVAVGFALATAVFIGAPLTGAGVNPARALGPMVVAGATTGWWIFLLAPVVGGVVAALAYDRFIRRGDAPA